MFGERIRFFVFEQFDFVQVKRAFLLKLAGLGRDAAHQGDSDSEALFIVPPFKEIALLELDE